MPTVNGHQWNPVLSIKGREFQEKHRRLTGYYTIGSGLAAESLAFTFLTSNPAYLYPATSKSGF
jgi:hypothetical protein